MKRLLFLLFIVSSCQSNSLKNSQTVTLNMQTIEKQSLQGQAIKMTPLISPAFDMAEKAVWEINNYLTISVDEITVTENQDNDLRTANIQNEVQQISLGKGTGFFISPTHIITNFHVIQNSLDENTTILSNKKLSNGANISNRLKLLKVSSIYDLALLESENPVDHYLDIETIESYPQTDSFLIAYAKDNLITAPIDYNQSLFDELILFQRDSALGDLKGTSGGPIINTAGNVVGVNHAGSDTVSSVISTRALNDFLNENNRDCSQSNEECIAKEWLFLNELSQEDRLAQYLLSTGLNYSKWLEKKQALKSLIENKKQLYRSNNRFNKSL